MGLNSTEVAYNFGQMGSVYIGDTDQITSNSVPAGVGANAVFCAITFIEDTIFNTGDQGLAAEQPNLFPDTTNVSADISTKTCVR